MKTTDSKIVMASLGVNPDNYELTGVSMQPTHFEFVESIGHNRAHFKAYHSAWNCTLGKYVVVGGYRFAAKNVGPMRHDDLLAAWQHTLTF